MSNSNEFSGKVALITGGASGIGKATAIAFAKAGTNIVIAGRRIPEGEKVVQEIREKGGKAIFVQTDVSKEMEVKALIDKTIETYGRLDYACNNAGTGIMSSFIQQSEEELNQQIDVNFKGICFCLKYQIPAMLKNGAGAIVNISSATSLVGFPSVAVYAATKAAIVSITKSTALEYAKSNIRINAISPGTISTPLVDDNIPASVLSSIIAAHPIGRIGQPEEISEAVIWLCSEKASFVIGHNLVIDGGYTAQ